LVDLSSAAAFGLFAGEDVRAIEAARTTVANNQPAFLIGIKTPFVIVVDGILLDRYSMQ
jgi:hypothetical protein